MEELDYSQLTKLFERIDIPPEKMQELKRRAMTAAAREMEALLRSNIAQSTNDISGRLRSWQTSNVGKKGGYAAVRPSSGSVGSYKKRNITNYAESGHKIRGPSGTTKRKYRPRIHVTKVAGRFFYRDTKTQLPVYFDEITDELVEALLEEMGF